MASIKQVEYLTALGEQHPTHSERHMQGQSPSSLTQGKASRILDAIKKDVKKATGHHAGNQRAIIKDWLLNAEGTESERVKSVTVALTPKVGGVDQGGWKGLTYSTNQGGSRVPKPLPKQREDFAKMVKTLAAELDFSGGGGQQQQGGGGKIEQKPGSIYAEWRDFVRKTRDFCEQRAADGKPLDEIGLRPLEFGLRMLRVGIPLDACKHAMTMHFPPEARKTLGVKNYDVKKFRPKDRKEGIHASMPYVMALIDAKVPVALVGPKGTGKTTLAGQIAELRSLDFGFVSMTSGTSPSAFNGRPRIAASAVGALVEALVAEGRSAEALKLAEEAIEKGDVVQSVWERIYRKGGVYLMDEMDAADENLLLKVNAALANGFFSNDATGEIVPVSENFVPMAGMNTMGLGATRDYHSRNRLDAATLDRWNMGRVKIDLDSRIEDSMVEATEAL